MPVYRAAWHSPGSGYSGKGQESEDLELVSWLPNKFNDATQGQEEAVKFWIEAKGTDKVWTDITEADKTQSSN